MARYIDKDHWEEEIVIPDTSTPVLGGQPSWDGGRMLGGFSNISPAILADRTRYIRNRLEELRGDVEGELESTLKKSDNLSDLDDIQQAKYNLELNLVDNTRDTDKPVSDATQEALDEKVDKVDGKGLSDENYTLAEKDKLGGIEAEATKNDTDAQLRDRATHTGVQPISSVSGLQTELDSKVDETYVNTQLDEKVDKTISVVAGAGLSGGGSLGEDRVISVDFDTLSASKAQTLVGEPQSFVSGESYLNVISWETGSHSSGTVLLDLDSSLNHSLEISGSVTVESPSNADAGKTGDIILNITSGSVVSWSTQWKFFGGTPDIGASGEMWVVSYKVLDEDTIIASANLVNG